MFKAPVMLTLPCSENKFASCVAVIFKVPLTSTPELAPVAPKNSFLALTEPPDTVTLELSASDKTAMLSFEVLALKLAKLTKIPSPETADPRNNTSRPTPGAETVYFAMSSVPVVCWT